MNAHAILGLKRGATPEEIKRAYRKLAMRWHPDRSDHPEATERFKEIGAAYETLTAAVLDVESEKTGDAPAPAAETETRAEAPEEAIPRAADIRLNFELSLEEAATGCRKTLHTTRGKACTTCEGSGEAGFARSRFCGDCHGSGRVHNDQRQLVRCTACNGRGIFTERICPDCAGSGRDSAEFSLEINVPPGMLPGDELRLAGQGEPAGEGELPGDLYLTIVLSSHPIFERQGRELHCRMPVSALAMLAGGEIELPTLNGQTRHVLEAGAPEPREIRLASLGYPGRGKAPAGDLVVELHPVYPRHLDAKQRKLLLQANAALLDDLDQAFPEIATWRRTLQAGGQGNAD